MIYNLFSVLYFFLNYLCAIFSMYIVDRSRRVVVCKFIFLVLYYNY